MSLYSCGGANSQKMRLKAFLFDLWHFENSAYPWEGLLAISVFVNATKISTNIETALLSSIVQLGEPIVFGTFSARVSLLNDMDDAHEVINNKQKVQNGCVC